jgi:sec-independent protein translocase protein TatC
MTNALPGKDPLAEDDLIDGGKVMSIFDHLGELRSRLMRAGLVVLVFFFIFLGFSEKLMMFLKQPLVKALPPGVNALHFTGPMDVFVINIKVAMLVGVLAACPVWLYQFWKFFEPALYPKERKYILPFIVASIALFVAGISFCFFIILPMTLAFLLDLGMQVGTPIITVTDYISMLMLLLFGFGIVFETPLIIVLLAMLDIIDLEMLTSNRRIIIIIILIVAAIMTPPDPISQMAMAVPVYLMYEMAIVIVRIMKRKKADAPTT